LKDLLRFGDLAGIEVLVDLLDRGLESLGLLFAATITHAIDETRDPLEGRAKFRNRLVIHLGQLLVTVEDAEGATATTALAATAPATSTSTSAATTTAAFARPWRFSFLGTGLGYGLRLAEDLRMAATEGLRFLGAIEPG